MNGFMMAQPGAAFTQGFEQAGRIREQKKQNSLADLFKTRGADIASGDPNALNALAQIDPMAARGIGRENAADMRAQQSHTQNMQIGEMQIEKIRADAKRATEAQATQMSEAERAAEAAKIASITAAAAAAYRQGPEAFAAHVQSLAPQVQQAGIDPAQITYENFPAFAAGLVGMKDGLAAGLSAAEDFVPDAPKPDYEVIDGQYLDKSNPGAGAQPIPGFQSKAPAPLTDAAKAEVDRRNGFLDPDLPPEIDFETEQKLRKEFLGIPAVKAFSEQAQAYDRIVNSARDPSPAGDLALIFNYMKVLDPGSVVRESEFATAEGAAAWLQKSEEAGITVPLPIARTIRKLATGERLSVEQRQDFVGRAEQLYKGAEDGFKALKRQYRDKAVAYSLDPDRALVTFGTQSEQKKGNPPTRAFIRAIGDKYPDPKALWDAMTPDERKVFSE